MKLPLFTYVIPHGLQSFIDERTIKDSNDKKYTSDTKMTIHPYFKVVL